jgi:hypothetical protein
MDPDKASAAQGFARDLLLLRQRAGNPSYSTLERLSGHRLKRATVSDVLNGNRVGLPDWRFVSLFVEGCRAAAKESQLDVQELGSLADWKRHWDGAFVGVLDARFPGGGHPISVARDLPPPLGVEVPGQVEATGQAEATGQETPQTVPPGRPASATWGTVPARQTDFVGRDPWMAGLRQRLVSGGGEGPLAVLGLCGIGKTQLAVEYAYRYAAEYDLVWWVPCDDEESTHAAMADLRSTLGVPGVAEDGGDGGYADLFDILRQGEPHARWLLIFDNANDPEKVRDLVPPMGGHVIITSRNSSWEATRTVLELDVFTREESIEYLRRRMPRFNPAEAHRIAEAVGDLPLLLEHAVEARAAIEEYLARLHTDPLRLLDSQPSDYPSTVAEQWKASLDRLRKESPAALSLLHCLCFFGNAPIPREALERGSYLQDASIHSLLSDKIRSNLAIMALRRTGLLRVDAATRTLAVHPVTRYIVRDVVAKAGMDSAARSRHDAHLLLAAADPLDPDDPANWRSYEQLREHAAEADVEACRDEAVRRLVINLVRFLNAAGDPRTALGMADSALARWTQEAPGTQEGRLRMHRAKIDALLAAGRRHEAFQLQRDTVELMRSTPGDWDDEMLLLGRVSGARYRLLGRFEDALEADRRSREAHEERFTLDHPHYFAAVGDVILDLTLTGQVAGAVRYATRVHESAKAFYGDPSHPAVLVQRNILARCLWLGGQFGEAEGIMNEVRASYRALADDGILDENHPWRLTHEVDFAVVVRDSGSAGADLPALVADLQDVHRRCWRTLGVDHPQTLAASVALGSVLRRIPGRTSEAIRVLAEAERRYQSALPEHPFTLACAEYLAMVRAQAATGDPGTELDFTPLPL